MKEGAELRKALSTHTAYFPLSPKVTWLQCASLIQSEARIIPGMLFTAAAVMGPLSTGIGTKENQGRL